MGASKDEGKYRFDSSVKYAHYRWTIYMVDESLKYHRWTNLNTTVKNSACDTCVVHRGRKRPTLWSPGPGAFRSQKPRRKQEQSRRLRQSQSLLLQMLTTPRKLQRAVAEFKPNTSRRYRFLTCRGICCIAGITALQWSRLQSDQPCCCKIQVVWSQQLQRRDFEMRYSRTTVQIILANQLYVKALDGRALLDDVSVPLWWKYAHAAAACAG